jgi:ribulose-5-phosphate 4-epimerase/fuculose-1-phosphate aldolase
MTISFFDDYKISLQQFAEMSQAVGNRSDYVQGGGGNTSCKLDNNLMAIKASGYRLNQITPDQGYAVLDYDSLKKFYNETDPSSLEDIEKSGSTVAAASVRSIEGLKKVRPSVEAGFHSMLERFVIHSHSIYANLLTCSVQGRDIAEKIMAQQGINFAYVAYMNPGAQLTFEIVRARIKAAAADGKLPSVIFLENHGLIATSDDMTDCLQTHEIVNKAIKSYFELDNDWAEPSLEKLAGHENMFRSTSGLLKKLLAELPWDLKMLAENALYPDQLVFLADQVKAIESGSAADFDLSNNKLPAKCNIFRESSEVIYNCGEQEALTMEQTIAAVLFIYKHVRSKGYDIGLLSDEGRDFISNWESEKYRKSINTD